MDNSTDDKISRRSFLKLIGAGIFIAVFGGFAGLIKNKQVQFFNETFAQIRTVSNPATDGSWEIFPQQPPVLPIHAALLRTGKVLFLSGSQNDPTNFTCKKFRNVVWDPAKPPSSNPFKVIDFPPNEPSIDVFCCGQSFLSDGRLLIAGGTSIFNGGKRFAFAAPDLLNKWGGSGATYSFDPVSEEFEPKSNMNDERWYPTLVTLANGDVFAISGWDKEQKVSSIAEVYSYSAERWTPMSVGDAEWPLYPHIFLMQNGRLFYTGGHVFGVGYDVDLNNKFLPGWIEISSNNFAYNPLPIDQISPDFLNTLHLRDQSCSVLLPPAHEQKIMIIGGGSQGAGDPDTPTHLNQDAIRDVHIIDFSVSNLPNPRYVRTGSLRIARMHHNAILLPDRTVFVCNGNLRGEERQPDDPQNISEIYNPVTETWKMAARASIPRLYHSLAILLPDGRVVAAGSNPHQPRLTRCRDTPEIPINERLDNEYRLEIYSPPYLFHGARPVIESVQQQEITYGGTLDITIREANNIIWVHLVRPMATTHSLDTEQRLVELPFVRNQRPQITAVIPNDPNLAPPGWYMLFIVKPLTDTGIPRGIPSVAKWVHLTSFPLIPGKVEHIAGVDNNDSVVEFRWSPSHDWQALDVSAIARGHKIINSISSYVSGNTEHIAGRSSDNHVYLFFRTPANKWDFVNVTVDAARHAAAGNIVGNVTGSLTSYVSGNVEHIAGIGRDGHVYLFFYIPSNEPRNPARWNFVDVSNISFRNIADGPTSWIS